MLDRNLQDPNMVWFHPYAVCVAISTGRRSTDQSAIQQVTPSNVGRQKEDKETQKYWTAEIPGKTYHHWFITAVFQLDSGPPGLVNLNNQLYQRVTVRDALCHIGALKTEMFWLGKRF